MKKRVMTIAGIIILIIIWIILSYVINNELVVPKVTSVIKELIIMLSKKRIYYIVSLSIVKIIFIMIISFLISFILAILSYKYSSFEYFLKPFIALIKTMPLITVIILIFMIFKMKYASLIATWLVSIPIMYEGILNGLKSLDNDMYDDLKTVTNAKNIQAILNIQIPMAFPYIKTAFFQTFGLSFKIMLMAEYISPSNNTLGSEMRKYYNNNEMEKVYCIVIISLFIIFLINFIFKKINKLEKNM